MLDKPGNDDSIANVVPMFDAKGKVPSLVRMAKIDPEVRSFLKLIKEENLREKAIQLLEEAIAKAPPPR